jgi:general secretion pathway protein F
MLVKILVADLNGRVLQSAVPVEELDTRVANLLAEGFSIVEVKKSPFHFFSGQFKDSSRGKTQVNWVSFSNQLSVLLSAGLTLSESLQSMSLASSGPNKNAIDAIALTVQQGKPLSEAIRQQMGNTKPVLSELVNIAEKNGFVIDSLKRFVKYEEEIAAFRSRIIGMLIYPGLVAAVGAAVVLFLLTFVLPRFATTFSQPGRELVGVMSYLLPLGKWLANYGGFVALVLVAMFVMLLFKPTSLQGLLKKIFSLPILRVFVRWQERFTLARFFQSIALLIECGHTVPSALVACTNFFKLDTRSKLLFIHTNVEQGNRFTDSLSAQFNCSPISLSLLRAGERTGNLPAQLKSVADFEIAEITNEIERYLKVAEPALLLLIGIIVAAVLSLLYLPLFDLAGAIK